MAGPERPCCHIYNDNRSSPSIYSPPSPLPPPPQISSNLQREPGQIKTSNSRIPSENDNKKNRVPRTSIFLKTFYSNQKRRFTQAYHRPVHFKPIFDSSKIQNGKNLKRSKVPSRGVMGNNSGLEGCLFPSPNKLGISQILRLQDRQPNLCFPIHALRPISSPMGLYESNQANNAEATQRKNNEFLSSGRFSRNRPLCRRAQRTKTKIISDLRVSWIHSKYKKIKTEPHKDNRVLGGHPTFRKYDSLPSTKQSRPNLTAIKFIRSSSLLLTSRARITNRSPGIRGKLPPPREIKTTTNYAMDELPHEGRPKGSLSKFRQHFQKILTPMAGQVIPSRIRPDVPSPSFSTPNDRRKSYRLGRHPPSPGHLRNMAKVLPIEINELAGAKSHRAISNTFPPSTQKEISPDPNGQSNGSLLHPETGYSQISKPPCSYQSFTRVLQAKQNYLNSQAPSRMLERPCRLSFPDQTNPRGMGSRCKDVQPSMGGAWAIRSRSVCKQIQQQDTNIHLPIPRSPSFGRERPVPGLESVDLPICLSSNNNSSRHSPKTPQIQRERSPHRSLSPPIGLVPQPTEEVPSPLPPSPIPSPIPDHQDGTDLPPQPDKLLASRLETLRTALIRSGLSNNVANTICIAHKPKTLIQYQSVWRKFLEFLSSIRCPSGEITIGTVCDFLFIHLSQNNRKYRTLTVYKCALALPLRYALNIDINCLTVSLFMRGVFASNPPIKAKAMPSWSLEGLLKFLNSSRFEPLEMVPYKFLLQKTLFLILLSSGRRIGEITNLTPSSTEDSSLKRLSLKWLIDFTPKHHTPEFSPSCPSIAELILPTGVPSLLCPVRAYRIFAERAALWQAPGTLDGAPVPLWIKPNRSSPNTILELSTTFIKLIKSYRINAGLSPDIPIGPHNTRKFAGSYAIQMGQKRKTVIKVMGFASYTVLKKNYVAKVPPLSIPCSLPGGPLFPRAEPNVSDSDSA